MNMVKFVEGKTELYLMLSGEALFCLYDKYGDGTNIAEKIFDAGKMGFFVTCEVAAILAEAGELYRRYLGYDHKRIVTAAELRMLPPAHINNLKQAVFEAYLLGFKKEVANEEKEIDLGLLEAESDKKKELTRAAYLRIGRRCGLSAKETLLMRVGILLDLVELMPKQRDNAEEVED